MEVAQRQLKAYLERQKAKRLKYPGSTLQRSVQSTVNLILRTLTPDSERYLHVSKVLEKMRAIKSITPCSDLDSVSKQMLDEAREFMRFMKFGFIETTANNKEWTKYEDPFMVEYLVEAQDQMEYGNFAQNYERQLLKKSQQHGWTEEFVKEWVRKAVYMKENNIQLFQSKPVPEVSIQPAESSFKRSASSGSAEDQTSCGEEPRKKVKKESLSYYVYIMSGKTIIKHMTDKKEKQSFQRKLQQFRETQDTYIFQTIQRKTAEQLFELRSYFKNFMEAFMEVVAQEQYKQFNDREMANRVLQVFQQIDPQNILQSYKTIVCQKKLFGQNWPNEMKQKIFQRALEMKDAQTKMIIQRQRRQRK